MEKDYLTEAEEIEVLKFAQNKNMFNAVKKVMLAQIYSQGKLDLGKTANEFNFVFSIVNEEIKSDEQIGQETRASVAALGYLKTAFAKVLDFLPKPERPESPKTNGAR